jgi:hypothetical protein
MKASDSVDRLVGYAAAATAKRLGECAESWRVVAMDVLRVHEMVATTDAATALTTVSRRAADWVSSWAPWRVHSKDL